MKHIVTACCSLVAITALATEPADPPDLNKRLHTIAIAPMWWTLLLYLAAKLTEHFDSEIYSVVGAVSGHSIKHMFAALACLTAICAVGRLKSDPENG